MNAIYILIFGIVLWASFSYVLYLLWRNMNKDVINLQSELSVKEINLRKYVECDCAKCHGSGGKLVGYRADSQIKDHETLPDREYYQEVFISNRPCDMCNGRGKVDSRMNVLYLKTLAHPKLSGLQVEYYEEINME